MIPQTETVYKTITTCRACHSGKLRKFLNLGIHTLPRFPENPSAWVPRAPLVLVRCEECNLVQLQHSVVPDLLFNQFWYRSGISQSIVIDLKNIAKQSMKEVQLADDDTIIDIGCNDGTLLSFFDKGLNRIGFEPAANLADLAKKHGTIVPHYFDLEHYIFPKAKLITAIAMFYDLEDPTKFLLDVAECLTKDGVFLVQQNYLGLMLENTAYDNICHEHLTYYSLTTLEPLLRDVGLEIYRVELNNINGGSLRTFIAHKSTRKIDNSVVSLRNKEKNLLREEPYDGFSIAVEEEILKLRKLVQNINQHKEKIMIYGSGTRGATIFQSSFPTGHPAIVGCIDNNPEKTGKYYLDSHLRISSPEQVLSHPNYFLVLPYHVKDEIIQKERIRFPNTKFIIPLPDVNIE